MLLNRRNLLVAGSSAGVAVLLFGCEQAPQTPAPRPGTGAAAPDGAVELYDGSAITPIDGQPINNPAGLPDRPLGGVDATVTVIEYVSPTCPHCANFHAGIYPHIKRDYIDTGLIRFIARPFRRNVLDLAVLMVAEASGTAYHDVLAAYMAVQNQWMSADNPRQEIFAIAQQFGFTQERFEEILTDDELFDALEAVRDQAANQFGVLGTPTFFINGQRLDVNATVDSLSAAIDAQL